NYTLKAAHSRFLQARAQVQVNRSSLYPGVRMGASIARSDQSENRPLRTRSSPPTGFSDFFTSADVSYEADIWGRVRQTIDASQAQAQASEADLQAVRLALQAELAGDYFELSGLDTERKVLESTVLTFEQTLKLAQDRFSGGLASQLDVARAQTQL